MHYLATLSMGQFAGNLDIARLKPAVFAVLICCIMVACTLAVRLYHATSI